jgi:Tol biopolymer transport system component
MTGAQVNPDLWVLPLFGNHKPFPLLATPFVEGFPRFSPDGRWVAYQSNETGQMEVYVIPFPGITETGSAARGVNSAGGKWQISVGGGLSPTWRRDGKEIFYYAPNTGLAMAASVDGRGTAFTVGPVEPTFQAQLALVAGRLFEVAPDGQRFLVSRAEDLKRDATPQPVTVVVNWTAAIRK